ncbi:iron export ABC transporter permease subunit FetB [Paenibacillus sp. N1-5-1-14]|uniref:ABC transporter permease n=1 Tax=Paenibacillus radicibacter TaxID=2972488 RepID=UPI0021597870|nr:iron export ABC transporter permease subunit FetB [Paenibacillus radicibacter]MCR8644799.1 iron export ABC transporter permease subunit FetB [Paenibacillus radicibacter]
MSNLALVLTLVFVGITMLLSMKQKLGLEKDILIGTIRATVQLLAVGYVLQFVFATEQVLLVIVIIGVMILVATWNAAQRAKGVTGVFWRIAVAIVCTEIITLGLLLVLQIIEPTARYMIPLSGMIIGNAMVACGLFLNQMKREVESMRGEIETYLALGATTRQAIHPVMKRSVKFSMIPTIDTMKTVGIVQLPGMMTGMIIAGANPVEAVRYQLLIVFSLSASAAIASMILSFLSDRLWFTADTRLRQTLKS